MRRRWWRRVRRFRRPRGRWWRRGVSDRRRRRRARWFRRPRGWWRSGVNDRWWRRRARRFRRPRGWSRRCVDGCGQLHGSGRALCGHVDLRRPGRCWLNRCWTGPAGRTRPWRGRRGGTRSAGAGHRGLPGPGPVRHEGRPGCRRNRCWTRPAGRTRPWRGRRGGTRSAGAGHRGLPGPGPVRHEGRPGCRRLTRCAQRRPNPRGLGADRRPRRRMRRGAADRWRQVHLMRGSRTHARGQGSRPDWLPPRNRPSRGQCLGRHGLSRRAYRPRSGHHACGNQRGGATIGITCDRADVAGAARVDALHITVRGMVPRMIRLPRPQRDPANRSGGQANPHTDSQECHQSRRIDRRPRDGLTPRGPTPAVAVPGPSSVM